MACEHCKDPGASLKDVPLEVLRLELEVRNIELESRQEKAEERWLEYRRREWPRRMFAILGAWLYVGLVLLLLAKLSPFPNQTFPFILLMTPLVPTFLIFRKSDKIWARYRGIAPEDAKLLEQIEPLQEGSL